MNDENKKADEIRKDISNLDISGVVKHIIFSLIVSIFLGAFYMFFKWKLVGVFLIFFIGYALLGTLLVFFALFVQNWGLKKIKEKEEENKRKDDELNF